LALCLYNKTMKPKKELEAIFKEAKGENLYYTLDNFLIDAKNFIDDVKKERIICSMKVSRSGMMRRFNFQRYNMLLNICYNHKFNWDAVRVGGCGMDMLFALLFNACNKLMTDKELDKHNINSLCGRGFIL